MKFFYVFFSLLFIVGISHGQIRIGGSDLLAPHFGVELANFAESREIDATVEFAGSYLAMEKMKEGGLEFGIVAIPDGMEMPGDGLRVEYVGAKVLSVVVPEANPLSEMTLRQVGGIFGEAEATNITRWGQVGLSGEWSNRSIAATTVPVADHTLALDLFRHAVLHSPTFRSSLSEADGIDTIRRRFQQDDNGIALLHRVPDNLNGMKTLSLARGDADLAYEPSAVAVANDDYPLRLPLYLIFREEDAGDFKELLRYVLSDEAAESMEADGLMPLPEDDRRQLDFEFERL